MKRTPPQETHREHLHIFGPAVLLVLLGFVLAYQFVQPAPPGEIRMASGNPDGAYTLFAGQYRQQLAAENIDLQILTTEGSIDNIGRLQRGESEVALIQGGTTGNGNQSAGLHSLGSLYFEPLWVFHRQEQTIQQLSELRGHKLAVGAEGSGTRALSLQLLADNRIDRENTPLLEIGGHEAARALLNGEVDSAFFVASPRSPVVRTLLESRQVQLFSFQRADAYTRIHPFLSTVVLPQGVIDLQQNLPERPTTLLAASANLVVREDLHPALIDLLLQAADKIHGDGGWFEERGQFPTPDYLVYPLHSAAERYYRYGPPFLQRYLPFWAATLVDRLKVMLLPFLALMIPLFKIMPPLYRWRMRSRIYRWYREVLAIDRELYEETTDLTQARATLQRIEREVTHISVPLSFAEELYDLRLHIGLVNQRLEEREQGGGD